VERKNNYAVQARQAREHFRSYDQDRLRKKLSLDADQSWLYTRMLSQPYRIGRDDGRIQRLDRGVWVDTESFEETMTLLDLVCDSKEDRHPAGRWKNMTSFGLQFHTGLLENTLDPIAERFARDPEGFARACEMLGGQRLAQGDVGYAIEVFDGLKIGIQLWMGDEEFPSTLKYMWDENALMYIRYETMYYARGLLLHKLLKMME